MDLPRLLAHRRLLADGRSILVSWLGTLTLAMPIAWAAEPTMVPAQPAAGRRTRTGLPQPSNPPVEPVCNVSVGPDGVLRGRVVEAAGRHLPGRLDGLRVGLLSGPNTVAVTTTGRQGEFSLQNLSQGLYLLVVQHHGTPIRRFCRVWNSSTAPPHAWHEISLPIGDPIVRAQYPSPFPIMCLRQAAIVTGIGVGAIAAPVIYHNAKIDNKIPATL